MTLQAHRTCKLVLCKNLGMSHHHKNIFPLIIVKLFYVINRDVLILCYWVAYDFCLDLEVEWRSKSARLITVAGYEDQVNDTATMQAIRRLDPNAAERRS